MRSLPSQFLQEASKLLLKAVASIQGHTPVYLVQHSTPRNMDSSLFASTKMSSRFSAAAAVAKSLQEVSGVQKGIIDMPIEVCKGVKHANLKVHFRWGIEKRLGQRDEHAELNGLGHACC